MDNGETMCQECTRVMRGDAPIFTWTNIFGNTYPFCSPHCRDKYEVEWMEMHTRFQQEWRLAQKGLR